MTGRRTQVQRDVDDDVRRLLRTPPGEFVAERNRVAKELRTSGERERATAVMALRRPRLVDWALNVAAAEDADATGGFAAAAAALADAQAAIIEGREGPDLRSATRQLRERTSHLAGRARDIAARAGRVPESFLADVTARLTEIAANPAATDLLRSGILGAEDPGTSELFDGLEPAERLNPPPTRPATRRERPHPSPPADQPDARALAEARRAEAEATKELAAADREVVRLTTIVEQARAAVEKTEARLTAAREGLDTAASALESAERHRSSMQAQLDAVADRQR